MNSRHPEKQVDLQTPLPWSWLVRLIVPSDHPADFRAGSIVFRFVFRDFLSSRAKRSFVVLILH